jgi:hypothetical protein
MVWVLAYTIINFRDVMPFVVIGIMRLEFKIPANPIPSFETEQTFDNRYNRTLIKNMKGESKCRQS